MQTDLYIIRHGEAVCNVESIVGGMVGCRGLTERGHAQARRLAERLARGEIEADVLYASTIRRARETAEPVAEALGLPIQWDDELHELRPGEVADGMSVSEVIERYGRLSLSQPYMSTAPGSESFATFLTRACTALYRIIQQHEGQRIVVISHGGIVDASFYLMFGMGLYILERAGFWTYHTSITHWRRMPGWAPGDMPRWHLMRYNDVAHLADSHQ